MKPICHKCRREMTPANSKLRPELFLCDECLPQEFKPKDAPKAFHVSLVLIQDQNGDYRCEMHPRIMKADTMQILASFLVASLMASCENGPIISVAAIMKDANAMIEKEKRIPLWPGW